MVPSRKRKSDGSPEDESLCRPHIQRQLKYDDEEWDDAFTDGNHGLLPSQVKDRQTEFGNKAWILPRAKAKDDEIATKDDLFQQMKADHQPEPSGKQDFIDLTLDDGDNMDATNASATASSSTSGMAGHLDRIRRDVLMATLDVTEIYSPPSCDTLC